MPRQRTLSPKELIRRAKLLRRFGYKVRLKPKTPAHKAHLSRQWKKVSRFVEPGKYARKHKFAFRFVETKTQAKREIAKGIHPTAKTPKGVFVRVPTNVRSYRIKWKKDSLQVEAVGLRGGRRVERVAKLDARALVRDASGEIRRVTNRLQGKRQWKAAKLVVNGYDAATIKSRKGEPGGWDTPDSWFHYMDRFFATAVEGTDSVVTYHGKPGQMSAKQFAEIFHIKVITQDESTSRTRQTPNKTRKPKRKGS